MSKEPIVVASRDGTPIARWTRGEGPPLVLVHGAASDHTVWARVVARLARAATVHSLDRRGRGRSGDIHPYAIEREFEDVAAVVDDIGEPAAIVGHSFGATCALGAARLTGAVRRLVLLEPGAPRASALDDELAARIEERLARGEREEALALFASEVIGSDPGELRRSVGERAWRVALDNVGTVPRELRAQSGLRWADVELARVQAPTVVVLGAQSPPRFEGPARTLSQLIPGARLATFPGPGHRAALSEPDLLAELVRSSLGTSREGWG